MIKKGIKTEFNFMQNVHEKVVQNHVYVCPLHNAYMNVDTSHKPITGADQQGLRQRDPGEPGVLCQ